MPLFRSWHQVHLEPLTYRKPLSVLKYEIWAWLYHSDEWQVLFALMEAHRIHNVILSVYLLISSTKHGNAATD